MTVGDRIRERRESLGLSQGDLAQKMGVSRQSVSKAELHDDNITTAKVTKFANALDTSEEYLMGWTFYDENGKEISVELVAREDATRQAKIDRLSPSQKKILDSLLDSLLDNGN